jgi:hypothetical protein
MENEINEKKEWQVPEVVDLDVMSTESGPVESTIETAFVFPAS